MATGAATARLRSFQLIRFSGDDCHWVSYPEWLGQDAEGVVLYRIAFGRELGALLEVVIDYRPAE